MLAPGVAYQCLTHFRGKSQEHKRYFGVLHNNQFLALQYLTHLRGKSKEHKKLLWSVTQ